MSARHLNVRQRLSERYIPLLDYVVHVRNCSDAALESAFPRIEAHRLRAEHRLRLRLQKYWCGETCNNELNALRPSDLLPYFKEYVECTFKAVGKECVRLFQEPKSYESFLHVVQDWILEQILPRPHVKNPREGFRGLSDVALVQEPLLERAASARYDEITIGLRETLEAFEQRRKDVPDDAFFQRLLEEMRKPSLWWFGGDWERLMDDAVSDAFRTTYDLDAPVIVAEPFTHALRRSQNRIEAIDFLTVSLEQTCVILLAHWWKIFARSKDRTGRSPRLDPRPGKRPRVNAGIEDVKQEIRLAKKAALSQKEICDRLGGKPRPANAAWNKHSWPEAFKNPSFRSSVKSWISRV